MNKSPTVFVVQDPDGKEIMCAQKFGTLRVILTGKETTQQAQDKLKKVLSGFKSGDYLLPIGKSVNMGIAIHYAWEALYESDDPEFLQLLVWRREQYTYTVETIEL